jgi:phenylalanyl-tRNA synthetase alpha chain
MEQLHQLERDALVQIEALDSTTALQEFRVSILGKKGTLTAVLRGMGALSAEERPLVGQSANVLRDRLESALQSRAKMIETRELNARIEREALDVTLPGTIHRVGRQHPLTRIAEEIMDIFTGMGFSVEEGPEVETEYYNFEALNLPPDHPARDMQDTFYVSGGFLLRTQTSPVQVRTMEKRAPQYPVRIISPGKVYRRDDDATHSPMFQQVEGLVIDKGISLGHLKSTLLSFARGMFGPEREIRLRSSFFPFTEPSAEVDVSCGTCQGRGCRTCKYTGWIEILGCGVVHPNVLAKSGYDPEIVSGFAFGMGIERIAMLKYGVDDLRHFFVNDLRFLRQF